MKICGQLPFNIQQAYGIKAGVKSAAPTAPAVKPAQQLVAGTVSGPVNFNAATQPAVAAASATSLSSTIPQAVFAMYTRAADKVEAAVAVQMGRMIDLKG